MGGAVLDEPLSRLLAARASRVALRAGPQADGGEPRATGAGAIDAVLEIRSDIGIDKSIRDLGGEDDLLPVLVEDATADPVNFSNPRPVDPAALESLYRAAW